MARKRAHNAVEDLKGKIRVYCRRERARHPSLLQQTVVAACRPSLAWASSPVRHRVVNGIVAGDGSPMDDRAACRVRPMLDFEGQKGQAFALQMPDELTVGLTWKVRARGRVCTRASTGKGLCGGGHWGGDRTRNGPCAGFVALAGLAARKAWRRQLLPSPRLLSAHDFGQHWHAHSHVLH